MAENKTVRSIASQLIEKGDTLSVAESCTGGLVGSILTAVPGASQWFLGGVTAYSNGIKLSLLGVSENTLELKGAVSEETAVEMAAGMRRLSSSSYSLSVTGIAGPSGGTADKPVGTVCMAICSGSEVLSCMRCFEGDRDMVRSKAAEYLLEWFSGYLSGGD